MCLVSWPPPLAIVNALREVGDKKKENREQVARPWINITHSAQEEAKTRGRKAWVQEAGNIGKDVREQGSEGLVEGER